MDLKTYTEKHRDDIYLFNQGTNHKAYEFLGAHLAEEDGKQGVRFSVWAPGVTSVSVEGDFNNWSKDASYLDPVENSGIWTGFIEGAKEGQAYKYYIKSKRGSCTDRADPYAFWSEVRPKSASVIKGLGYEWHDSAWMEKRSKTNHFEKPKNIYEVHLGSWKRHADRQGEGQFLSYEEIAKELVPYAKKMGYTHLEIMPVMEHPLDDSWGYQVTGYFSATSRFGTPQGLMELIDKAHRAGLGVILDWVPAHFCSDQHGLVKFNGYKLYEKRRHPQWGTLIFDYGRPEVKSFLLSSAMFWLEKYHADGIRVDGVSSMLYLNFGIDEPAQKTFNKYGEEGNLEAIDFLRALSDMVGKDFPGVFTAAEESTAWPMVTYPPKDGGLGFHYKWDMGWMNDTLRYVSTDYLFRKHDHNKLTFSMMYAFSENFILPLSHDEVVHGKRSIIGRQQGDYDRQFAGVKVLAAYQMTHPGGKLNFMGNELGQFIEWRFYEQLEWFLLDYEKHRDLHEYIRKLNHIYLKNKEFWEVDHSWDGFTWIDANDNEKSILVYSRWAKSRVNPAVCIMNFGWNGQDSYRFGVPKPGRYEVLLSSGAPQQEGLIIEAEKLPWMGQEWSLKIDLPQTSAIILKHTRRK